MNSAFFLVLRRMRAPIIVLIVIYSIAVLGLTLVPGVDADGKAAPPGATMGRRAAPCGALLWPLSWLMVVVVSLRRHDPEQVQGVAPMAPLSPSRAPPRWVFWDVLSGP